MSRILNGEWSAEPWEPGDAITPHGLLSTTVSADGEVVAASSDYRDCVVLSAQNQARARAAVNACAGIPTEMLHAGLIRDLEAAVRECFRRHGPLDTDACRRVEVALREMDGPTTTPRYNSLAD